jgi:pimeloyl-ACP methyl ester carboxylesterase
MLLFQLPALPERLLAPRLEDGLRRDGLPEGFARAYADALAQPGALTAALNWYRAVPLERRRVDPVAAPTTFVWSTGDRFLTRTAAELTARWVSGPYRAEVLEGLSHWLPETAPDTLAGIVLDRLRDPGGPAQEDGSPAGP